MVKVDNINIAIDILKNIANHYYCEIDKIFTVNFTLLGFVITAITILLMLSSGKLVEFKEAGLLDEAMSYFYKSLTWSFISGAFSLAVWILNTSTQTLISLISLISILFLSLSLYYTYQAYKFLIFFVNNQK